MEAIRREGKALGEKILRVDSFLNHLVDVELADEMGRALAELFRDLSPQKVLTAESSGIVPALFVARHLGVKMLFARRKPGGEGYLSRRVPSPTRGVEAELCVRREYLGEGERVLIVDDFLAEGLTALALASMVEEAGGRVCGMGFCVEKSFQGGRERLSGYRVVSLAVVDSLDPLAVRSGLEEVV